ncbi:TetR/AcrR family transcriptional regulator [Microbacterium suwonense]|uniref:HTH tetR-type domain-containing protein n=1 Tax=Microbacterium suwonense TaxID=683047 RepID=A0ABN6X555_9MICO|nr:helix-turn-helix domain-containing protein [Microbacterium suwonense]BDZ39910.1 hypothetical protein GCM10025863_25240 [Microbacterium suwonense]
MARWAPDSRGRLENAAFELFEAEGFSATTVPEIAERAGLTTRTFFRHFADKREVLFADGAMSEYAQQIIADAPPASPRSRLCVIFCINRRRSSSVGGRIGSDACEPSWRQIRRFASASSRNGTSSPRRLKPD